MVLPTLHEQIDDYVRDFRFGLPGWEGSRFDVTVSTTDAGLSGIGVQFWWTMHDSTAEGPLLSRDVMEFCIEQHHSWRVSDPLSAEDRERLDRLAWSCVLLAVSHEAGEFFGNGDQRPADPHPDENYSTPTWWQNLRGDHLGMVLKDGFTHSWRR